jgi:hypothetical protein
MPVFYQQITDTGGPAVMRVFSSAALVFLCAVIVVGCGKKEEESGGGGGTIDGQPRVLSRNEDEKKEAVRRLKEIGLAMHSFHDANGSLPAGVVTQNGQLGLSWRVLLLPYFEDRDAQELAKEVRMNEPWDSPHNKALVPKMPKIYESPGSTSSHGKTFLRSFVGPSAIIPAPPPGVKGSPAAGLPLRGLSFARIPDGTSNTLMVVEAAEAVEWTKPDDLPFTDVPRGPPGPLPKLGLSGDGFYGLMCDGAVHFFPRTLSEQSLRALISVNGGEVHTKEVTDILFPPRTGGPKIAVPSKEYEDITDGKGKVIGKKKSYDK